MNPNNYDDGMCWDGQEIEFIDCGFLYDQEFMETLSWIQSLPSVK